MKLGFPIGDTWKSVFPAWLRWMLLHAILLLLIQQLGRLIWFAGNAYWLQPLGIGYYFKCFLWGFYFDLPVLAYVFLPLWLWWLLAPQSIGVYSKSYRSLFAFLATLTVLLNGIDAGYSIVTSKRSGVELMDMLSDPSNKMGNYIQDYWFGVIGIVVAAWVFWRYVPMPKLIMLETPGSTSATAAWFQPLKVLGRVMVGAAVILFLGRGGFRLRPLRAVDAAEFVLPEMGALVVSTPFQMLSSLNAQGLKPVNWLPENEAAAIVKGNSIAFNALMPSNLSPQKNIVVLVVESLARDYTGFLNGAPYTPFLDQLAKSPQTLTFPFCYANGTKSIEMAPSIFAGMPSLMEDFYITSGFSTNKLNNAFGYLNNLGYQTAFFHGSNNGTMGFQSFLKQGGLQHYYGLDQYPKDLYNQHFDGHWGIYDEPYLQYALSCMDTASKPMFQAVFTLSSHHPYSIPEKYVSQLPGSNLTVQKTIAYADLSLRKFFQEVAKKSWYKNTVFVITGDHTSHGTLEYFYSPSGHYEIPLLVFAPGESPDSLAKWKPATQKTIAQTDILPTVLSMLTNQSHLHLGFGRSALDSQYAGFSFHKNDGLYYCIQYPLVMAMNDRGEVIQFYAQYRNSNKKMHPNAQQLQQKEAMKKALMAQIQVYNQVINANKWDEFFGSPKP